MFQYLSYLQNFILLKSVEYIKSFRYLSALYSLNSDFLDCEDTLKLFSTLYCHKRNHMSLFTNMLKTGASFLSTLLVNWRIEDMYTSLSILLDTFSYRDRGTCGPSTLNYSLNGVANV